MNNLESFFSARDGSGVWPLLLQVCGYAAMERGSDVVEPIDLLKAIYVVDLEHVANLWENWEDFERLIIDQKLINGHPTTYINRTLYILNVHLSIRGGPDDFRSIVFGSPSRRLEEIVSYARLIAHKRAAEVESPTSRDLLFSIFSCDSTMRHALQASGLLIDKLAELVGGEKPNI